MSYVLNGLGAKPSGARDPLLEAQQNAAWAELQLKFGQLLAAANAWKSETLRQGINWPAALIPGAGALVAMTWSGWNAERRAVEQAFNNGITILATKWNAAAEMKRLGKNAAALEKAGEAITDAERFNAALVSIGERFPTPMQHALRPLSEGFRVAIIAAKEAAERVLRAAGAVADEAICVPGVSSPDAPACVRQRRMRRVVLAGGVLLGLGAIVYVASPYLRAARAPGEQLLRRTRST